MTHTDSAPGIRLRNATRADLSLLQHWDRQAHVLEAGVEGWDWKTELSENPAWREQLIAELDGRAIGFIQIIDPAEEETHYWGDVPANLRAIDIWIGEADCLGRGHGTCMIQLTLQRCFADPKVTAVLIDPLASNTRAHRFYERFGFRRVEHRSFGEDDCVVYQLTRADYRDA
ncbi:MAG: GNAT family N-acetyltransferase [Thiotrichales bacterium]